MKKKKKKKDDGKSVFEDFMMDLICEKSVKEFCDWNKMSVGSWDKKFLTIMNDNQLCGSFNIYLMSKIKEIIQSSELEIVRLKTIKN